MAKTKSTLEIIAELKTALANEQMKRLGKNTDKQTKKMKQGFAAVNTKINSMRKNLLSVKSAIGAIVVGAGLKKLGASFLQAANTTEQLQVRLRILLGSVEEGNRLFKSMSVYASMVPFEFEEIMESATMLAGIMKGGVNEVSLWIPLIGDLAAATGLGILETTEQVQRMLSAGAASAIRFRQLGVLAMLGFKAGVSYSAEETRKVLFHEWRKADSQFRGSTAALADTWEGMLSMLADKWFKFRNKVMNSGLFEYLKTKLTEINILFDANMDNIVNEIMRIASILRSLWNTFTELPEEIQKIGIIGAILFGKKIGMLFTAFITIKSGVIDLKNTWLKFEIWLTKFWIRAFPKGHWKQIELKKELAELLAMQKEIQQNAKGVGEDVWIDVKGGAPKKAEDVYAPPPEKIKPRFDKIKELAAETHDRIDMGMQKWAEGWFHIGDLISSVFVQAANSADSFFVIVVEGFKRMLTQMAIELAAKAAVLAFLNIKTGGVFGGGGGLFGGIGDIFKSTLGFKVASAGATNYNLTFNNQFGGNFDQQYVRNNLIPQLRQAQRSGLL